MSTLFQDAYAFLSEIDLGLIFLASGGGMIVGSISTGKVLDRDYQMIKKQLIDVRSRDHPEGNAGLDVEKEVVKEENYPIERARLRSMPIYLVFFAATTISYGWAIHQGAHISIPLILLFVGEFCLSHFPFVIHHTVLQSVGVR